MKLPLNYAILKFFTNVDEASVDDVMINLESEYGDYKAFEKNSMLEAIMTAESNGLLDESRFALENDELVVYYGASQEQKETINKYID